MSNVLRTILSIGILSVLSSSSVAQSERVREFSFGDTNRDLKYFYSQYQEFSQADSPENQRDVRNAIVNLCQTHDLICFDPRYQSGEQLPGLRARVASQLRSIQKELSRRLPKTATDATDSSSDSSRLGTDRVVSPGEQRTSDFASESILQSNLFTLLQFSGGPSQLAIYAGNHGPEANGQDLVELIQSTIEPLTWDVNGGTGHIHFYRPQCLLVVRSGSVIQDQIGGLLGGLRGNR